MRPNTALDVLKSQSPSFALLASKLGDHGITAVKAIMTLQVNDLVSYFNIGKTMNAAQVASTVNFIVDDYLQYKPDDLKLCFDRAKKDYYGAVYDRIDGQIILGWLARYDFERDDEIGDYRVREKRIAENVKPEIYEQTEGIDPKDLPVPMPDYVKDLIKTIAKKDSLPAKEIIKTPDQILIDGFIQDFNAIHKANDDFKGGGRYIHFHSTPGRTFNVQEYIEYRVLNHLDNQQYEPISN